MNDLLTILSAIAGISTIGILGYTLLNFKDLFSSQAKPAGVKPVIHPIPTNISQQEKEEDFVGSIGASRGIAEELNLLAQNSDIKKIKTTGSLHVLSTVVGVNSFNMWKLVEENKKLMAQTDYRLLSKDLSNQLSAVEVITDSIRASDKFDSSQYFSSVDTSYTGVFKSIICYEKLEAPKFIDRPLVFTGSARVTTNKRLKTDSPRCISNFSKLSE